MAPTKREQLLIERFKKSGGVVDQEKIDAPFGVLVRPLATVGLDAGKFALWFEEKITEAIKVTGLTLPIRRIMISPHIIDPTVAQRPPDNVAFKRRENSIFVAIGMDHSKWMYFSDSKKLASMYDNIRQSICKIPQKHIGDSGREALLNIVGKVYIELQSRLVH